MMAPMPTAPGPRRPRDPDPPEVMTIDDLAGYLQLSKSSLYKLAQEGRIPGQKVGRHWRFHKDTIDEWLKRSPREARQ
jgi:excisionase family DNA binding protein